MNGRLMFCRIRTKKCWFWSIFTAVLLLLFIIYYKNNEIDDGDFFNELQERSPYNRSTISFIVPDLRLLNLRTACAIEAAAFHHPKAQVVVYSFGESKKDKIFEIVGNISNVNIQFISVKEALKDTPLYDLFPVKIHEFANSRLIINAIVLALISKHGGIYLSNDIWCLKPLSSFRNLLLMEKENHVITAALSFDRWHRFPTLAMKELRNIFLSTYNSDKEIFKNVLKESCVAISDDFLIALNEPFQKCEKTKFIVSPDILFPTLHSNWNILFTNKSIEFLNSYSAVRLWNEFSQKFKILPGSGAALDYLAERFCNKVYNVMKNHEEI